MGKKTVRWNQLNIRPGTTCPHCHGEGHFLEQDFDFTANKTIYPTVYCTCHTGQRLKKEKEKGNAIQRF